MNVIEKCIAMCYKINTETVIRLKNRSYKMLSMLIRWEHYYKWIFLYEYA